VGHGVSKALYLRDPDENGRELYWDRPRDEWPRTPDGRVEMYTRTLDIEGLLRARPRSWHLGRGTEFAVPASFAIGG
jgi:catechol-2,3-dioxygenase